MNKLKEEMIKKDITLSELSKKTMISTVKLTRFCINMDVPTFDELDIINEILQSSLKIEDFKKDQEKIDFFDQSMEAVRLVYEDAKKKYYGSIECPVSKKRLNYIKSKSNGHIHAKCETENCIFWME